MPAGTPAAAKPAAGLDLREGSRRSSAVAPVGDRCGPQRGAVEDSDRPVDERENEHWALPTKGEELGFYFVR